MHVPENNISGNSNPRNIIFGNMIVYLKQMPPKIWFWSPLRFDFGFWIFDSSCMPLLIFLIIYVFGDGELEFIELVKAWCLLVFSYDDIYDVEGHYFHGNIIQFYNNGFCCCRQDYSRETHLSVKLMVATNLLRNFGMVKSEQSAL